MVSLAEEGMTMLCVTHEMALPALWPIASSLWIAARLSNKISRRHFSKIRNLPGQNVLSQILRTLILPPVLMTLSYPEINNFLPLSPNANPSRRNDLSYGDAYIGRGLELYGESSLKVKPFSFQKSFAQFRCQSKPGQNIGLHTCPSRAVGPGGRVIAFEPQRIIFQVLCANLAPTELPMFSSVTKPVINQASGDQWIHVPPVDYSRNNNFGGIELGGKIGARSRHLH